MIKATVTQAAEHFNVSKEAIHNRVRRGSLTSITENNQKFILIEDAKEIQNSAKNSSDGKYYEYIEKENEALKAKIIKLEEETKSLREQREQMLIDERRKIELIYKEKDEQLKNILQIVENKFLAHFDKSSDDKSFEVEVLEAKSFNEEENMLTLKSFLKNFNFKEKEIKIIKDRFKKAHKKEDKRVILKNEKLHVIPSKYNYDDFLR
jgi:hypothetical protein